MLICVVDGMTGCLSPDVTGFIFEIHLKIIDISKILSQSLVTASKLQKRVTNYQLRRNLIHVYCSPRTKIDWKLLAGAAGEKRNLNTDGEVFSALRRNFFITIYIGRLLAYTRRVPTSYEARRERSPIGCQLVKNFNIYSRLLKAKIWRLTTTQAGTRQCKRCAIVKSAEVQKRVITTSANEIVFTSLPFLLSLRTRRSIAGP